tara:strand:+ start:4043 stop:6337 length:2295 start_codon:yes stop_codon:yes gene_type:complete
MPKIKKEEFKALKQKYQAMVNREFSIPEGEKIDKPTYSREYNQFKKELYPKHLSLYEKLCNFSEKIMPIKPDKKKLPDLIENLETCHLNITPAGVMSFSILIPIFVVVFGGIFGYIIPMLIGESTLFFALLFLLVGGILLMILPKVPEFLATQWRMKSSNQMIISIFYTVTFMRHTSNLEGAIKFAADHLSAPLSFDFRKILWDVETERFSSVSESVDNYLFKWKKYNIEFVESFHLVQGSLFESSEQRRLGLLDKSLEVILEGTYDKMLHFAHNLSSPITMLHMLGVILPILGLVILPLVVSFLTPGIGPPKPDATGTAPLLLALYIVTLYNIALPLVVYFMGQNILAKRPPGYGAMDISNNPELKKFKNWIVNLAGFKIKISPLLVASLVFIVLFSIGMSPIILNNIGPTTTAMVGTPPDLTEVEINAFEKFGVIAGPENLVKNQHCKYVFCLLDYKRVGNKANGDPQIVGPYGGLASFLSVFVVLAVGLSLGIYYKLKSKNIIKIRNKAKELEKQFASAIFQLGNRLGDGFPAEIAFSKVAATMQDTVAGRFMKQVSENINHLGMSVEQAIFDKKHGALVYFPSNMIQSTMKVLVQSIKKGPRVAAQALISISRYIKEIRRVDERLKDLLADVVSSMKSQINFLAPSIAGIVIAISSMMSVIINYLTILLAEGGTMEGMDLDFMGAGVPPFYFQIIVGLYVVQIVFILTILVNNILNGSDKLNERFLKGKNLVKSTVMYCFIAFTLMIIFNYITVTILGNL